MPGSAAWQFQREATAATHLAGEMYPSAVCLHDVAYDGEAQAGRADVTAGRKLCEAFEDALPLLRRNSRSRVTHRDQHHIRLRGDLRAHPSCRRRIANGVGKQVRQRPGEFCRITGDRYGATVRQHRLERDGLLLRLWSEDTDRLLDDGAEINLLPLERDVGCPRPGQVEQTARHVLQAADVFVGGPTRVRCSACKVSWSRPSSSSAMLREVRGVPSSCDSVA